MVGELLVWRKRFKKCVHLTPASSFPLFGTYLGISMVRLLEEHLVTDATRGRIGLATKLSLKEGLRAFLSLALIDNSRKCSSIIQPACDLQ